MYSILTSSKIYNNWYDGWTWGYYFVKFLEVYHYSPWSILVFRGNICIFFESGTNPCQPTLMLLIMTLHEGMQLKGLSHVAFPTLMDIIPKVKKSTGELSFSC